MKKKLPIPPSIPDFNGKSIDAFDLPDYMYSDPLHYSEEWYKFISDITTDESVEKEYRQLIDNIMKKQYGADVRLTLAIFVYLIYHGFTVTLNEFQHLTDKLIDRMEELEKSYQDLLDEWKNTLAGVTVDSEVINARIDLHGFVNKTLKERLDTMQAVSDKLNPVSEVFAIEHNQYGYPSVRVMHGEYGVGTVPLGTEPQGFGGASSNSVNCDVEYQDMNSLSVKVPLAYAMSNPTVERISENEYILVEGINTLIITIGNKAEANVETFVTRTMMSDFNGKVEGSIIENSHTFKRSSSPTLQLPSGTWVENTQANYDSIMGLDGVVARYAYGTSTAIAAMLFSYDFLGLLEQNFPSIFRGATTLAEKVAIAKRAYVGNVLSIWGKGRGPSGNLLQMKVLNASGTWSSVAAQNATDAIKGIASSSLDANRITNEGKLHTLANAEASDGTTASSVSVDYANITLTARVPFAKK